MSLFESNLSRTGSQFSATVLRAFVGGQRAPQDLELDDDALTELATKELEAVLETSLPAPTSTKVLRWKQSLPFYNEGTTQRWEAIEALVGNIPGLHLGGNWLYGASVADCITRGDHIVSRNKSLRHPKTKKSARHLTSALSRLSFIVEIYALSSLLGRACLDSDDTFNRILIRFLSLLRVSNKCDKEFAV